MSMLSHGFPISKDIIEGSVLSVDGIRFLCTVKTTRGQRLNNVSWLLPSGGSGRSTSTSAPKLGDRVVVATGLGYPLIIGFLPKIDRTSGVATHIDSPSLPGDVGNSSAMKSSLLNPGRPGDFIPGDNVITSEGGGMVAVLRGGSILLKAGRLSQLILSKLDDGVKMVARSFDFHSEVASDIYASVKGRVYRWMGIARTPSEARQGLFRYQEVYGDTLTGEALKDNYELGAVGSMPASGGPLKKVLVVDANQIPLRIEETDLLGNVITTTRTADGVATNVVGYSSGTWDLSVTNGTHCRVRLTKDAVFVSYNNEVTATFDTTKANIVYKGDASVTLDATGVTTHKGACDVKVLQDSILMGNGSHFVNITPSGVQMG